MVFDSSPKYSKLKKNFENFKLFLSSSEFSFSVICFSERSLDDLDNSTHKLSNYISKPQARSDRRGAGVSIYIHNFLKFKERSDLSINNKDFFFFYDNDITRHWYWIRKTKKIKNKI